MRRCWGDAAGDGDLGEGRVDRNGRRDADLRVGSSELPLGLAGISAPASLDQEKGRVRWPWWRGVRASKRKRKGSF
jgi:hypothetical protein